MNTKNTTRRIGPAVVLAALFVTGGARIALSAPENTAPAAAGKPFRSFPVYSDANSPDNHYTPSGWMGDHGDILLDLAYSDNPHSGTTSIRIAYSALKTQGANWAGVYWQHPPNNWGDKAAGFNLSGATKLVFWARGERGGERIQEFRVGGAPGDTSASSIGPMFLKAQWTQYEIDLSGTDLGSISGGFMWSANAEDNPKGCAFYLDDIKFL